MSEPAWRPLFGFDEPYENQADAIEAAIAAGERGGYLAMEGPCGTGKTMAALTAAAHQLRRGRYDTVVVVTPVKQQLEQFVADLRTMNAGLDDPLDGVALVGKADLCPYGREGAFPEDVGVHDRCEDLREHTADLVEAEGGTGGAASGGVAVRGEVPDDRWWDPDRARDLVRAARRDVDETLGTPLATAGAESPYPRAQPSAPDEDVLYCPFEADWYARDRGSPVGFEHGKHNVVTSGDYLPAAVERGTCPHRAMGVLLEAADVVIGNYNHLFDPRTRPLVASILDERTFVIVDEAHRLEGRVRDLLSDEVGRASLRRARGDCEFVLRYARESPENERAVADALGGEGSLGMVERAAAFYDDLVAWLHDRVDAHLEGEFDDVGRAAREGRLPDEDVEIPLRDPETAERDALTDWAADEGYDDLLPALGDIGGAVEDAIDGIDPDRTPVCAAVGALMAAWDGRDHATYFREIVLARSPTVDREPSRPWERAYAPRLVMYNCMPAAELAGILESLGGGVLMSATLEPLDVFREVSGLDRLSRPVIERTYDLPFPESNRASWIVDAPPFTARNRGDPALENENATREEYAQVLREVARCPGNVLVCLPNYREARWAGERLRAAVDKPVLIDESSGREATDDLKRRFFAGDGKVLVTSTRGTLTEGVDYEGDKLAACAVIGVPLVNIGSPRVRAVRAAYADAFGPDRAFEYALTVPAVRRARQAIGRVIRGPDERGIRILADARYTPDAVHSVHGYLPAEERAEFTRMTPDFLAGQVERFWNS